MQLSVTGHHIDITESLRNYVGTKLAKLTRLRVPKRAPVPPKKGGSGPTVLDPYGGK